MRGYEPVQLAFKQRLLDRLPARLVQITGEMSDSVPLPEPKAYRLNSTPDEAEYPVVYILPADSRYEEQTGGWLTSVRGIQVFVVHREDDTARLGTSLVRYERAIVEAILDRVSVPIGHIVKWISSTPGPTFEMRGAVDEWQSWMQIHFEVTQVEEDL